MSEKITVLQWDGLQSPPSPPRLCSFKKFEFEKIKNKIRYAFRLRESIVNPCGAFIKSGYAFRLRESIVNPCGAFIKSGYAFRLRESIVNPCGAFIKSGYAFRFRESVVNPCGAFINSLIRGWRRSESVSRFFELVTAGEILFPVARPKRRKRGGLDQIHALREVGWIKARNRDHRQHFENVRSFIVPCSKCLHF